MGEWAEQIKFAKTIEVIQMTNKTPDEADGKLLHCSFCGKNQNEVKKLIAGPSVYVCDEWGWVCEKIGLRTSRHTSANSYHAGVRALTSSLT